jgi:hypothetical protein
VVTPRKTTGDELLLAHLQMLSEEPPESRLSERVEPSLAALLVRALRLRSEVPRGARRL